MTQVLIVEDSKATAQMLRTSIERRLDAEVVVAASMEEARAVIADGHDYSVAVCGLYLPDAPNGEVIDFVQSKGIPVIVLTGSMEEQVREAVLRKAVIDYVIKRNKSEIEYVANLVRRIDSNRSTKILIVDDSRLQRHYLRGLLQTHQYQVLEAGDGEQALALMHQQPDVAMVITDYEMPNMSGIELVAKVRERWEREELAVIGISGREDLSLPARLLKAGASDYLTKPFLVEEFYLRVNQNIEIIEHVRLIKEASNRDYLTGLYNRKYLFDAGQKLYHNAQRGNLTLTAAMIDIDFFKKINDTHGHQIGDEALRLVAKTLQANIRKSDLVARYGGEEFCMLLASPNLRDLRPVFEKIRQAVESAPLQTDDGEIAMTVSIGISACLGESLEDMLGNADEMLYRAKESGRNRVVAADESVVGAVRAP